MNPVNQFIQIAPDCPLQAAIVPEEKGGKQSIAVIEYQLLSGIPYGYTLRELKFRVHALHKQIPLAELKANRQRLWDAFFAKPCACMRASPLTKKYGWGVHYDMQGKIAIYPVESQAYRHFVEDVSIKKYFAMRDKRT
jgi:hypothetical protein